MKKIIYTLLIFSFFSSFSQIPKTLSFQGVLLDNSGQAVTKGNYEFKFQIFDAVSGGTSIWSEPNPIGGTGITVYVNGEGIYNAILGKTNPLNIPFDQPYFMEVTVNGETLTPRTELTSNGYELNADLQSVVTGQLDGANIANGSIVNAKLASGIDGAKLINESVTGSKIDDGSIQNVDLASGIDGAKLSVGSVSGFRITDGSIENVDLASGINGSKISNGTITDAKLSGSISNSRLDADLQDLAIDGVLSDARLESTINRTNFDATGDIRASDDISLAGGLYVGNKSGDAASSDLVVAGGVNIGATSTNPGTGDLYVNDQLTVNGNASFNSHVNTTNYITVSNSGSSSIYLYDNRSYSSIRGRYDFFFKNLNDVLEIGYLMDPVNAIPGNDYTIELLNLGYKGLYPAYDATSGDIGVQLGDINRKWARVYAFDGVIYTSDRRYKTGIETVSYGLSSILNLKPVEYYWKTGKKEKKLGLVAQEVMEVIPELVDVGDDPDQTLGLNYTELIPVLIKAIQEQQELIDSQQETITSLNSRLTILEEGSKNTDKEDNPSALRSGRTSRKTKAEK